MIAEARTMLAELLSSPPVVVEGVTVPVYPWLPLRANELPCIVVGRPSLSEGDERAIVAITTPVFVLGRTVRDDDAQRQLDAIADAVFVRLWWITPQRTFASRMTDLDAVTMTVAELDDVPAYTSTVVSSTTVCP